MHRSGLPFQGLLLSPSLLPGSPAPAGDPEHTVVTAAAQLSTGVCTAPAPTTRSSTTRLLQSRPRGGSKPRPPQPRPDRTLKAPPLPATPQAFLLATPPTALRATPTKSHAPTGLSRSRPLPATPPRQSSGPRPAWPCPLPYPKPCHQNRRQAFQVSPLVKTQQQSVCREA